jgi:hypothetical protein
MSFTISSVPNIQKVDMAISHSAKSMVPSYLRKKERKEGEDEGEEEGEEEGEN